MIDWLEIHKAEEDVHHAKDHKARHQSGGDDELEHSLLVGLLEDVHTLYLKLTGRSGGQTIQGGTATGDDLTLESTSHATKGDIALQNFLTVLFKPDGTQTRLTLQDTNPIVKISEDANHYAFFNVGATTASLQLTVDAETNKWAWLESSGSYTELGMAFEIGAAYKEFTVTHDANGIGFNYETDKPIVFNKFSQMSFKPDGSNTRFKIRDEDVTIPTTATAPTHAADDGAMIVDNVTHRLYIRSGGVWKYITLT